MAADADRDARSAVAVHGIYHFPKLHRRSVGLLVAIASLGGLLFGYSTGEAAGAFEQADFLAASFDPVLLISGTLLGAVVGALGVGRLADLIGRRDVIMATTVLFTTGAFLSAIAPSALVLLAGRLVLGVAVGAISVAAPMYISEIAPTGRRGALICIYQLMITVGILLAFIGNEFVGRTENGWRILLVAGAIPGLILSGLALLLVESPVWLALKGDQQAALAVLERLGREGSNREIKLIGAVGEEDQRSELADAFSLAGRAAIFIGVGLFFVQQFIGINAIIYYSLTSLAALTETLDFGLSDAPGLALAVLNVPATLVAVGLIDRIGRRRLLMISLVGCAAGLAVMAFAAAVQSVFGGANILSVAGLFIFITAFAIGLGPIPWVVAAEVQLLRVRGLAMGVVVASHWLFDTLASPVGELLSEGAERPAILALYAAVAVVGVVIFRRRLPETKGRSLLAIDRYFKVGAARLKESSFMHYTVATLITIGGGLSGYNFAVTALTLVLIRDEWDLGAAEQGALASALVVGLGVGSILAGPLSDRFGRRYVLMAMAAMFVASAFGAAVADSMGLLLVARTAAGIAAGLTGPTASLYIAEVAPAAIRGRLLSFGALAYGAGAILAYCVGLLLEDDVGGWRLMFGFLALPATIYGLALLPLPESPRWLAAHGQLNAARRSLLRLVGVETDRRAKVDRQLAAIIADLSASVPDDVGAQGGWARLWAPVYRRPVLIGVLVMFLLEFTGQGMVAFYAPTILSEIGFSDTTVSFALTFGLGVVSFLVTLVAVAIIDRIGRKRLMVTGLFAMAAGLVAFGALSLGSDTNEFLSWGKVGCLVLLTATFGLSLGLTAEVIITELYPQSIRGLGSSLVHGMRSIFGFVFVSTFPFFLVWPGLSLTVLAYAAITVVGAFCLLRVLPETKGKSLEDISEYWNRVESRRRRAEREVSA